MGSYSWLARSGIKEQMVISEPKVILAQTSNRRLSSLNSNEPVRGVGVGYLSSFDGEFLHVRQKKYLPKEVHSFPAVT